MAGWKRLSEEPIDTIESSAMWTVLELLVPDDVAELFLTPVDDALVVHNQGALESLTGQPLSALPAGRSWIIHEAKPCLSPLASLAIAEMVCHENPVPVIERILADESESREKAKRGGETEDWKTRETMQTSPEYEYRSYLPTTVRDAGRLSPAPFGTIWAGTHRRGGRPAAR